MPSISTLVDRVKIIVLSSGSGPFVLGGAVPSYRGIEALIDGTTYSYATESASLYEVGLGTYDLATGTLIRSPIISSNGGAVVLFPANIELSFTVLAGDIAPPGTLPIVQIEGTGTNVAMSQNATTEALALKADTADLAAAIDAQILAQTALSVQVTENVAAGDFVNFGLISGNRRARLALATTDTSLFANGFAPSAIASGATGLILPAGWNRNAAGVAAAANQVWLSSTVPGGWTATPPDGVLLQALGMADPANGIYFGLQNRELLL